MNAFAAWAQLYANLYGAKKYRLHTKARDLINTILIYDDNVLHDRSQKIHEIIGGRASVLPPDTRFDFGARAQNPLLFLFGSADSLIRAKSRLFETLNRLPFYSYINIGLESIDQSTLEFIGKPLSDSKVRDAFMKMLDINEIKEQSTLPVHIYLIQRL
jgi:hypothetical protein